MDYFCYISRSKVDQLYQNISRDVDEWIEKQTTEHDFGPDLGGELSIAGILKLFKGDITYDRKGIIQKEKKIKVQYRDKLYKVLMTIAHETTLSEAIKHHTITIFGIQIRRS